jgi:cyanophycinase
MIKKLPSQKGRLVLIGGAEDRNNEKTVLQSLIKLNNARKVVIIPTATLYPRECGEDYLYAFRKLGANTVEIFDIRDTREAEENEYIRKMEDADLVFFTGGDQVRLTRILSDSKLIKFIKQRFLSDNLTVAGTSAGASAAANPMTYDGDNNGLIKGSVKYEKGFGFIENIAIDTHFVARGRLGRMTQFLCNGFTKRGIGIGENTSITIHPDNTFNVTGSGIVTVVSTENLSFSNFDEIDVNGPISIDGIQLGFLQQGAYFDMNAWKTIKFIRS